MGSLAIQWHITTKCRNKCKHCYMEGGVCDLTYEKYQNCIENVCQFEKKYNFVISHVALTGGDPFLNTDWQRIVCDLISRGKKVSILGNPELLSETVINQLSRIGIYKYQLSLDGLENTHDKIRGRGSFERTISALKRLGQTDIPVHIMFTVSDQNSEDLFPLINYLDELNIAIYFAFDFVISAGEASKNCMRYSGDKKILFDNYLFKKQVLLDKRSKVTLLEKPSQLFVHKLKEKNFQWRYCKSFAFCSGCGAGWKNLTFLSNGDVLACRRLPLKIGNLLEDSFEKILLESPLLIKLRNGACFSECGTCKYVQYCRGCPAENYATSKNPFLSQSCPWYEQGEATESFVKEIDKLMITPNSNVEKILDEKNPFFVKSLFLLNFKNENRFFLQDPQLWLKENNLQLSNNETDTLYHIALNAIADSINT